MKESGGGEAFFGNNCYIFIVYRGKDSDSEDFVAWACECFRRKHYLRKSNCTAAGSSTSPPHSPQSPRSEEKLQVHTVYHISALSHISVLIHE